MYAHANIYHGQFINEPMVRSYKLRYSYHTRQVPTLGGETPPTNHRPCHNPLFFFLYNVILSDPSKLTPNHPTPRSDHTDKPISQTRPNRPVRGDRLRRHARPTAPPTPPCALRIRPPAILPHTPILGPRRDGELADLAIPLFGIGCADRRRSLWSAWK